MRNLEFRSVFMRVLAKLRCCLKQQIQDGIVFQTFKTNDPSKLIRTRDLVRSILKTEEYNIKP